MRIEKRSDLARLVKLRRQAQGRTQKDVADAVGITRQSLARIEQGDGGTSFDSVLRVLSEVGIRLEAEMEAPRASEPAQRALTPSIDTSALMAKAFQNVDYSAINRALAAGVQSLSTSARAASATRNLNTTAIVKAMTAGMTTIPQQLAAGSWEDTAARSSERSDTSSNEDDPSPHMVTDDHVSPASSGDVDDD